MAKILIVEDNALMRQMLSDQIAQEGHTILLAYDGQDGLSQIELNHPDAIILDILMPRMDGITMLKKLRSRDDGKNIPVMMLTTIEDNTTISEAMKYGVTRYMIKKNTDLSSVVETLHAMLNKTQ